MKVVYNRKRTGPTFEKINEEVVKAFVAGVLDDHRETPDQFVGSGRKGRTPFHRTGKLIDPIEGFFFKRASAGGKRTGLIGTIRAPLERFASIQVRNRFIELLHKVWGIRGLGWSQAGKKGKG